MSSSQISTISEFLLHAGTDYRVFDMGRGIRALETQAFLDLESGKHAAPYPRNQHAWFGIVFWDKTRSTQQYIWFVKLPLDEQGLIVGASRNHFLQIIVDALGSQLENTEAKNGQLPENPYTFIPNQHQLADFNSISRATLNLGHSQFHTAAWAYLQAPLVLDWQGVALQGIADVVSQMQEPDVKQVIAQHLTRYPTQVVFSLLVSLENQTTDQKVFEAIHSWILDHKQDPIAWQHGLRALSRNEFRTGVKQLLENVLASEVANDPNTLLVISGRLWQHLSEPGLLQSFMQKTADVDPSYALFQGVFRDLVQVPDLRNAMLMLLRLPEKPPVLAQAIGSLFQNPKGS
ncbi:MAG: DUF3549 family protein [Aliiglaciecola sp.]